MFLYWHKYPLSRVLTGLWACHPLLEQLWHRLAQLARVPPPVPFLPGTLAPLAPTLTQILTTSHTYGKLVVHPITKEDTMATVTIENTRNGAYYVGIPEEEAQAICDEWNEGTTREHWRVVR